MSFLYSGADFTYPLLSQEKALQLIGLLGFNGVDIALFQDRSHVQPSMIRGKVENCGKAIKTIADDAGLVVADVFLQSDLDFSKMAINHPDKSIRDESRRQFLETLEYANACQCCHVTCLPGVTYKNDDASLSRCQEELTWRVEKAEAVGITLGIEAHLGSIIDTPDKAMCLIGSVPKLTLTLDYSHFTKTGIPDARVEPLVKHASHFHARAAKPGAIQTVLTENTIDYRRIVKVMQQTRYKGFIGIEYNWIDWEGCNRTDNVSESILLMKLMKEAETA